jgi:hypothetical protein
MQAIRIVTSMPVALLRTASKQLQTGFQVARQRLSDTLGERIVTRVSSFDTSSSTASPKPLPDNGLPPPTIIETCIRENESIKHRKSSSNESPKNRTENSLLSPRRVDRAGSLSHLLSPVRLSSLFRGREPESPQPRPTVITRNDSDGGSRSSQAFMQFFAQGRSRSSESLASDDVLTENNPFPLPRLPFIEPRQSSILPRSQTSTIREGISTETCLMQSLKRPADTNE